VSVRTAGPLEFEVTVTTPELRMKFDYASPGKVDRIQWSSQRFEVVFRKNGYRKTLTVDKKLVSLSSKPRSISGQARERTVSCQLD
jgi:hypothetical protein